MTSEPTGPSRAPGLRVGYVPGVTLTKWRRIWAERLPRLVLDVVDVAEADQRTALVGGEVDMCFVRLPLERERLHAIPLYEEVAVVVMPKDHPLAECDEVSLADLAGEPLVEGDAEAGAVERVAWGSGLARMPQSVARSHSRRDVVYRPVIDAEPTTIALAWRIDNPNELIEEFVGIVRGRTANSSRTAADRAAKQPAAPRPEQKRPRWADKPKPGRNRRR